MNSRFRGQLIAALLINGLVSFLVAAREPQGGQRVADNLKYPPSQETIQVDAEIKSKSLSGLITDPSRARTSQVLVERVRPGWGKRIAAVLTDSVGRFAFARSRAGTHFLRISKPGFNTMLLKIRLTTRAKPDLDIELRLSH